MFYKYSILFHLSHSEVYSYTAKYIFPETGWGLATPRLNKTELGWATIHRKLILSMNTRLPLTGRWQSQLQPNRGSLVLIYKIQSFLWSAEQHSIFFQVGIPGPAAGKQCCIPCVADATYSSFRADSHHKCCWRKPVSQPKTLPQSCRSE